MLVPLFALFALAVSWTRADDHLVSQVQTLGLRKRFVDPQGNYNITIVHTNDVHSHIDEFIADGTDCVAGKPCFGGYARIKTKVDQLRQLHPDSLFINAGDEFQGTLFYTFLGPPIIADTLNQLGFDAMTLGNHEFDGGNTPLVKFIKSLNFPVISANVKTANGELESVTVPYKVFPKHDLAIIAATTVETPSLASPDAGTVFLDPIKTVQDTVDHVLATEKVKRIIVLTHTGYDIDIKIAQNTRNVHLIVGGHTHTLLGNFPDAVGPYPTIEKNLDGEEVFVVTAAKWGRYLGKIDVAYNSEGKIVAYTGAPIVMESTIPQNPQLQAQINGWRKSFAEMGNVVIGNTVGTLDMTTCQEKECSMGDAVADALLEYRSSNGVKVDGAIINSGGIRATIHAGNVTWGNLKSAFPFPNAVVDIHLTGQQLWDVVEGAVSLQNERGRVSSSIQVSKTMSFSYNPSKPAGSKLISLSIGTSTLLPAVDKNKTYTITTVDYLAKGGDNLIPEQTGYTPLESVDVVFQKYLKAHNPLNVEVGGRISTTDATTPTTENAYRRLPLLWFF